LLLSYSSIFAKSLLTNFFAPFLGCTGIQLLVPFLVPLALRGSTSYMHPHISGTECVGFSKQDAFRLSLKVSGANVHWANANHTFLTHKNPQTDTFSRDINPAKLHSTAQVWHPQGISKLVNKVDCQVPCASLKVIVWALLATKPFAAGSSMYPCHMACISKSVPRDVISLRDCHPQRLRSTVDETRDSRGQLLSVPSLHSSGFSGA
jgi:hypothetical protein